MNPTEIRLLDLLRQKRLLVSLSQGRRVVSQGGVRVDGEVITDVDYIITPDHTNISVGKKTLILKDKLDGDDPDSK